MKERTITIMISKEETEEGETTIPGEGKKLRKGEGL